ncbi:MAG TPA: hypothetical protein DF699_02370, partial [Phycisphaerales bacterium]|nr:hypothetical protein [Phycisphaerales bacterium]
MKTLINITCAAFVVAGSTMSYADDLPAHPREIQFDALEFVPPNADEFRYELSNGVPVYMAPSDEFPLVDIRFSFKGGGYLEPADKAGLSAMTGQMIRTGGSAMMGPSE